MRLHALNRHVDQIQLGRINCYLVRDAAGCVLIDSGLPLHGPALLDLLRRERLQLDAVLLTHRHLDHVGSAAMLAEATGADVVVHEADAAAVQGRERLSPLKGRWNTILGPLGALLDHRVFHYRPCRRVTIAADGWQGYGLRLIHLPGHTPGHCGYVHTESRVVLAGDSAKSTGTDVRPPSRLFTVDPAAARQSQRRLADLAAPIYGFGHGPALHAGAEALRRLAAEKAS